MNRKRLDRIDVSSLLKSKEVKEKEARNKNKLFIQIVFYFWKKKEPYDLKGTIHRPVFYQLSIYSSLANFLMVCDNFFTRAKIIFKMGVTALKMGIKRFMSTPKIREKNIQNHIGYFLSTLFFVFVTRPSVLSFRNLPD